MAELNFWKELTSSFSRHQLHQRKLRYFRWKHGIDTNNFTYSEMSEEEFKELLDLSEIEYMNLQKWESSADYKRLTFLLKEDKFASDLLEIYDATKKLAEDGDSQAIKNMIMLQKEIKNYRKGIDDFQGQQEETETDDGLTV